MTDDATVMTDRASDYPYVGVIGSNIVIEYESNAAAIAACLTLSGRFLHISAPSGPALLGPSDELREALGEVMRMVVVGSWYDEPEQAGPAVNRLHTAERAMWRLYDLLGVVPGDYARPEAHSDGAPR